MSKSNFSKFEAFFGLLPVLRTEDRDSYERIRAEFMRNFQPTDILEWQLINRLVEEAWFIKRYSRHQTLAIERWYQQGLEFQVQRLKAQNTRKEQLAKSMADRMRQKPAEVADLLHLEEKVVQRSMRFSSARRPNCNTIAPLKIASCSKNSLTS
jgi:hypothetical protein